VPADPTYQAAVLGAGSWGTSLAVHLGALGHDVRLWARDAALVSDMSARRANPTYLPDIPFPDAVQPTADLSASLDGARYVVLAVPSHGLRGVLHAAVPHIPPGAVIVSAVKGIETDTLRRMSEVIGEETGGRHAIVVLSGPSFASEVARGMPTALVAASVDPDAVRAVQHEFRSSYFRVYGSEDVIGVELGAALKNIIAIAAGVVESAELGHNAMAALITRGLAEMSRLSCALGGKRETLAGLSGLGDLVLTCTGQLSRNRHVGVELGKGRSLESILSATRMVAEGVKTTRAALELAERHDVELPIALEMRAVLAGQQSAMDAVGRLMLRRQRGERDGER
jgi:glycerol-3-phosphate dehydrogenase (NAD(P)+)